MKLSLAIAIGLTAAIAAGPAASAQASSPPIVDANGQEYCKAEITPAMKEQIGQHYFQRSDRQNTATVKTRVKQWSRSILNCLDHVDAAVEKQKDKYSPEQLAAIRSYVTARRTTAEEDFYQAMIRAGHRPSTIAPKRYSVCEYEMEFHHPEHYVTITVWSPVFYDREADTQVPTALHGVPVTKTEAEVMELLRAWAQPRHKPFIAERASCHQFDQRGQAQTWRSARLEGPEDFAANIRLPASAMLPIQ